MIETVKKPDRDGLERELNQQSAQPLPPSRRGKAAIVSHHDPAVAQQLKILAAREGTTQQFLLAEALNMLFASRGIPQIADSGPRTRRATKELEYVNRDYLKLKPINDGWEPQG
jgi:hypothetical protein